MQYGEIVELGRHKLMCGDATRREDVLKLVGNEKINLVLTDPPYGMKCQHKDGAIGDSKITRRSGLRNNLYGGSIKRPPMIGDNTQESARKHYEIIKNFSDNLIFWGGQYFAYFLPVSGGWLFWNKHATGDFSDGELAWTNKGKRVRYYSQKWNGVVREGSKKLNPVPAVASTQKPVELHMKILEDFSKENDLILDCFGGSGTTLIACEMTGRKCLMMEISPEYCDIICKRYEKLKGGGGVQICIPELK